MKNIILLNQEELALKYIVNNFEKSLEIGVRGVAKNCFASTSVVMNLAKKLGYKGFVDMVYRLEFSIKNSLSNSNSLNNYCTNLDDEKTKNILKKFNKVIQLDQFLFMEQVFQEL